MNFLKKIFATLTGGPNQGFNQPNKKLLAEQHQLESQHHEVVTHEQEEHQEEQQEQRWEREASEEQTKEV